MERGLVSLREENKVLHHSNAMLKTEKEKADAARESAQKHAVSLVEKLGVVQEELTIARGEAAKAARAEMELDSAEEENKVRVVAI